MTMGTGLVLFAIGAILRYAVQDSISQIDLPTVGLILMIVGAVAFVVGAIYAFGRRDSYDRPPPPPRDPRY
jgi:vacuolar-type H+-ATPase subunit I/STV1